MRKRINFYGNVQGVGFRYTCQNLATDFNLNGWVKNNKDGSVTLVLEGSAENINLMLNYLKQIFDKNIIRIEEILEPEEKLTFFEIKYGN